MKRYAIYWTPARGHPLWRAGCEWLGRDAERPALVLPARPGTDAPRRYGFHATLKAPMRLRDGHLEDDLLEAVQAIADAVPSFAMPALEVRVLQDFAALQPVSPVESGDPLRTLADRCVIALDRFRHASMADDMASRAVGATGRRRALLDAYGYPFVLDAWRFHMTLSDALPDDAEGREAREALLVEAGAFFAPALAVPLASTEIALFVEPAPDRPFVLTQRFALRGTT